MDIQTFNTLFWIAVLIVIWSTPWKAIGLWKSARRKDYLWFIVFTIFNTAGVLEIIYIFIISKNKDEE